MKVREVLLPNPDLLPTYILYLIYGTFFIKYSLKVRIENKKYHLKKLSYKQIKKYSNSDTVFILGSGKTINEITKKQWKHIKKHDSIGFNKWIVHDHIPTLYMFENGVGEKETFQNFQIKKNQYKEVPIIYKTYKPAIKLCGFPSELRDNLYLSTCFLMPGEEKKKFFDCLHFYSRIYDYLRSFIPLMHIHKTGTLFDLILIAAQLNYKNIVLMGVDLNSTLYFYEEDVMKYKSKGLSIPPTGQYNKIHKTYDKSVNNVTIDVAIEGINSIILRKLDINLYIGSKKSALYPLLPYYFKEDDELHD